ncbi:LCP family protein [Kitasatospora cheerisanensis]|uniref:Transcriptional regulator n=1 Tax=Kitasatospora cheerisanensis KCTC 2395 TaxID=1348663 RepID=A0A066Z4A5_9ACTN|nr:LCP family protein [Kitasatospora cheerisanensis]KDN85000.1 transcriptional regulator [Kitasatospora cheerisanensis KCTC 2395]
MNTWQERPGGGAYGQGDAARGRGGAAEPPLPPELNPRGTGVPLSRPTQPTTDRPPHQGGTPGGYGGPPPHGGQQPYGQQPFESEPNPAGAPAQPARPRRSRKKIIGFSALGLVLALLVTVVGTYFWADGKLRHENVLADYPGRPAAGKGTNWLIVGSDSREGLTDAEEDSLHTGSAEGKRSDSMMILHIGDNGNTLMSIPRDSWVQIPAHQDTSGSGKSIAAATRKINASFASGGGRLLVQTVETNTGLRIDHYAEIGFAGFVGLVDAVGGVEMTIDQPVKDKDSGLDLQAGTQTLSGKQALAFVRQRHQMADQDLGRMRNQQKFLGALAKQAASPGTLLNPFTFYPLASAGLDTLIVDEDAGLTDLGSMFLAMKGVTGGDGKTITVPIGNADYRTPTGESAVKWDPAKSKAVFDAMKNDTAVPDAK